MFHPISFTQNPHYQKTYFGFWLYLLTDCMMFASLFASYMVLEHRTCSGPTGKDLFHLSHTLGETLLLLTSSLFAGIARTEALRNETKRTMGLYILSFLCGAAFLFMTFIESARFIKDGFTWQTSAFLSAFYTLIWTHAFHVIGGLIWILVILFQLYRSGITLNTFRRLSCLTMFLQFLSLVWIFTFTMVYLMGVGG